MTFTEADFRAMAARLIRYRFTTLGPMLAWAADQIWPRNEIEKGPHNGL